MPLRAVLIIVLFIIGIVSEVHAEAPGFEYREQKGLILLEDYQQAIELRYQFQDHNSNAGGSSTSNMMTETYNLTLDTSILDPNVFEDSLSGTVGFNQSRFNSSNGSNSTDQAQYQYIFTGTALKKSITPITIRSTREITTVATQYTPSYTSDTTTNEITALILNDMLTSKFDISRTTLDNSGGGYSNSASSNSFSYLGEHHDGSFSSTVLTGTLSDQESSIGNSHINMFSLTNRLAWGEGLKYTLLTSVQFLDAVYTGVPENNLTLAENFRVQLGRALTLQTDYTLTRTRTNDFLGNSTGDNEQTGDVVLKHRLFESLESTLTGKVSSGDLLGGTETKYSGAASMSYRKRLSDQDRLIATLSDEYDVDNRAVTSSVTTMPNVKYTVHQGDSITLPLAGGMLRSIISITNGAHTFLYTEGTDYTVNLAMGIIYILPAGRIDSPATANGTDISISYTYVLDPSLKYDSNQFSGGTIVTLNNGLYSLGAQYTQLNYGNVVGSSANAMRNQRTIQLNFTSTLDNFNYHLLFTNNVIGDLHSNTAEGDGSYHYGNLTLALVERYAMYGASESSYGYRENTSQCSLAYTTPLFWNVSFSSLASLLDIMSTRAKTSNYASLRSSVKILLNKLTINLMGQTGWTFTGGNTMRDDSFTAIVTRMF